MFTRIWVLAVSAVFSWVASLDYLLGNMSAFQARMANGILTLCASYLTLLGPAAFSREPLSTDEDFVVDFWQSDSGLPNNAVTCVLQTKDRYLWIGTSNGLARFDGEHFTVYRPGDNPGLKGNCVLSLHEDPSGKLWIGTADGGLIEHEGEQFRSFTTVEGLSSETVLAIHGDQRGSLWVGTASGLNRRVNQQFSTYFKNDGLPDDRVFSIAVATNGSIIFGTGKGLAGMKSGGLRPKALTGAPLQTRISCLSISENGTLYAGIDEGLFSAKMTEIDNSHFEKLAGRRISAVLPGRDDVVWYGTADGDLRLLNQKRKESCGVFHVNSAVSFLCGDVEGNVWAGTAGDGLARVKARKVKLLSLPECARGRKVACTFLGTNGEIFVVVSNWIHAYQNGRLQLEQKLPLAEDVTIQTASLAPNGLWLGTRNDGLLNYKDGHLQRFTQAHGLSDDAVEAVYAEEDGGVWITTRNGGLNHVLGEQVIRYNTPWGFYGNIARAIARDEHTNLWIGTIGDGLFKLRGKTFRRYTEKEGLPSDQIYTLYGEREGNLWIGTAKGLACVRDGTVAKLGGRGGLPDEAVLQLRVDSEGNLWVGGNSGVYRVRRDELTKFAAGACSFVNVVPFGREDGLPNFQCVTDSGSQVEPAGERMARFVTSKGLLVARSKKFNELPPAVFVQQVRVDGENVRIGKRLAIAPGRERVEFEFYALSFTAPGKTRFRYRLNGLDRDWTDPSPSHLAHYTRIPAGDYVFRVIACNDDGVWNEEGATVQMTVIPYWWQTWTFRMFAGLMAGCVTFGIYRLQKSRNAELERLRVRIAGDLHDEVGSSLWSITLLSRMLAKHGNLGAQEKQDIEEIQRIASHTSNSIRDIIWLINPAFDTVQDLMLRTQDFARTLLRGVDYRLTCEATNLTRKLSPELKQNLFLFFKEALTNIARHSKATAAEVRIEQTDGVWKLSISDNGVGFDAGIASNGNGLKNLQARARKIGGELKIQTEQGKGTTLLFSTERL